MARSSLRDPLEKYRWTVTIDGFSRAGFTSTTVPEYKITNKKYPEGGAHLHPRKIVDSVDFTPVTLTRGVTNDTSFNKWANGYVDKVTNNAAFNGSTDETTSDGFLGTVASIASKAVSGALNNGAKAVKSNFDADNLKYRRTVKIEHVNRAGQVEVVYMLYNAYPIEYKPASEFNSTGDDGVSIESLTLDYESFEVMYSGLAGALANIVSQT